MFVDSSKLNRISTPCGWSWQGLYLLPVPTAAIVGGLPIFLPRRLGHSGELLFASLKIEFENVSLAQGNKRSEGRAYRKIKKRKR